MTQPPLIATFVSVSHNELLMYNLLSDLTKERVRRSDNLSCDSLNHCEDEGYFASVRATFFHSFEIYFRQSFLVRVYAQKGLEGWLSEPGYLRFLENGEIKTMQSGG